MKKKNKLKLYSIYIAGMVFLIVAAFLLPQIVFTIRDNEQMKNTKLQERTSQNLSQISSIYEKQMHDRMSYWATMDLNTATVTTIGEEPKDENKLAELLDGFLKQSWFYPVGDIAMFSETLDIVSVESIKTCKKYIVYRNDYQEGIALMMWYMDIYVDEMYARIQLLVDSETNSIYYMKLTSNAENPEQTISDQSQSTYTASSFTKKDKKIIYCGTDTSTSDSTCFATDLKETFAFYDKIIPSLLIFYSQYYEADEGETLKQEIKEKQFTSTFEFPYGESNLDFIFQITSKTGSNLQVSVGIPTIGKLIPEMKK